jgi:hypothetical protein
LILPNKVVIFHILVSLKTFNNSFADNPSLAIASAGLTYGGALLGCLSAQARNWSSYR